MEQIPFSRSTMYLAIIHFCKNNNNEPWVVHVKGKREQIYQDGLDAGILSLAVNEEGEEGYIPGPNAETYEFAELL